MFTPDLEATFIPGEPARSSYLALWRQGSNEGETEVVLALPAGSTVRRRSVGSRAVPVDRALEALVDLDPDADVSPSVRAWSVAARLAVDLVARGRILPSISSSGFDTWRLGPLDAADAERRRALAEALPPEAHALVIDGATPMRVWDPLASVEAFFDTVADVLPRTATAPLLCSSHGAQDPVDVSNGKGWLSTLGAADSETAVGLRLELPDGDDVDFAAVLTVQSLADPSLVMEASSLWEAPEVVLTRFGANVDTDLLVTLRRGARVWPPLGRFLDQATPDRLTLDDEEAEELLGRTAEDLTSAGIAVLWPADVFAQVELRPVIATRAPAAASSGRLGLEAIAEMRWRGVVGGEELTEAETLVLAEAKRPIVRVRGRWVRADPERLARLRERRRLGAGAALAAALGDTTHIDGETFDVEVTGPIAELADRLEAASGDREMVEPAGLTATLRPYQRRGLAWLSEMSMLGLGGVLADDMGLGKTVQVLALHVTGVVGGPMLVVCPASVIGNWEREAQRFVPSVPVRRFHGADRHLDDLETNAIVLATFGVVRRDVERLGAQEWGLVVADEAQAIKNPMARTARAMRSIHSKARLALTGTPVENHLGDLWAILDWTTPGLLGPYATFRREVALPIERYRDREVTEMFGQMVRPFMLRRLKVDPEVAPDLPPKIETDELMPLTTEQATLYRATVEDVLAQIEESDGINRRGLVLKLLTGLKQICNHPAQFLAQPGPLVGRSGKLDGLTDLIEVIRDEGDAALVFTQFVAMGRLIEAHLGSVGARTLFLHGSVPVRRRQEMVDAFQRGEADVFVISLKAGGTGLNLTRATHVVHYDRWWNPAVEDQASDRAWRIGQDRMVQVHRMVCEGTVEDRIARLLEDKRALAEAVVGSGEGWITEMSDSDLAALVALGGDD
jgi:superfamily II DNA or RNA helicase